MTCLSVSTFKHSKIHCQTNFNFTVPDSQMLPNETKFTKRCQNSFCCEFEYSFSVKIINVPRYYYALVVFNGTRNFDGFTGIEIKEIVGFSTCAVVACTTDSPKSCGQRNTSLEVAHDWHKLDVAGYFSNRDDEQFFSMPNTLDLSIMPFDVKEFEFEEKNEDVK